MQGSRGGPLLARSSFYLLACSVMSVKVCRDAIYVHSYQFSPHCRCSRSHVLGRQYITTTNGERAILHQSSSMPLSFRYCRMVCMSSFMPTSRSARIFSLCFLSLTRMLRMKRAFVLNPIPTSAATFSSSAMSRSGSERKSKAACSFVAPIRLVDEEDAAELGAEARDELSCCCGVGAAKPGRRNQPKTAVAEYRRWDTYLTGRHSTSDVPVLRKRLPRAGVTVTVIGRCSLPGTPAELDMRT